MNREIKFRAWDEESKSFWYSDSKNGQEFCNFIFSDGCVFIVYGVYRPYLSDGEYIDKVDTEQLEVKHLEQYTGLKDKNGVDVYESDIVSLKTNYLKNAKPFEESDISEHIYTVKFFDGMFALARGLPFNNGFVTEGEIEVIGNIHENPELL